MSDDSYLWLESSWLTSETCLDAPQLLTTFYANGTSFDPSQLYPPFYDLWWNEWGMTPYPANGQFCGELLVETTGFCCLTSLDKSFAFGGSFGYSSGAEILFDPSDSLQPFPVATKDATYCQIDYSRANTNLLNQFVLMDGSCATNVALYGSVACDSSSVSFYSDFQCSDLVGTFDYPQSPNITLDAMELSVAAYTFGSSVPYQKMGWNTQQPQQYLVPGFHEPSEILGFICLVLSITGHLAAIFVSLKTYRANRSSIVLFNSFVQFLWLLYNILRFVLDYTVFPTIESLFPLQMAMLWCQSLAELTSMTFSLQVFHLLYKPRPTARYCNYALMAILHITFAGGTYGLSICNNIHECYSPVNPEPYASFYRWYLLFHYSIIIMLLYNMVPVLVMAFYMHSISGQLKRSKQSLSQLLLKVFGSDIRFNIYLGIEVLITIVYFGVGYAARTTVLGDDRSVLATHRVLSAFISAHTIVNYHFSLCLPRIFKQNQNDSAAFSAGQSNVRSEPVTVM
ncbi:hypothetical protein HDU91_006616 [Kappamyces sp. JEL0680]|nr:hypothetical protein HDU91_006616 [Kappamyces sp. JEL0680]